MAEVILNSQITTKLSAKALLSASTKFWFATTVVGQWIFASYVLVFYGGATFNGDIAQWNKVMPHGYVEGDLIGNLAVAVHLFLALIVLVGGPLQLIPTIRNKVPKFHRINGRVYILTAFILAIGGLFMVWTRGVAGADIGKYSISINALLILLFAFMAVKNAIARNIKVHLKWAIRLFLVMGGVWFFRVGLMLWLMIHQAPVGFDPKTFEGPFLTFLGFAQFIVPLIFAELYFKAAESTANGAKFMMATTMSILALMTIGGIVAATMSMWLPRM
ncbi:DUF2306 domain-containing protein [Thalassotalea sp. M1531]|uniref:DUF2306 domain-containing protein n=1 Tax=Thalassotalea algicola TaxID=2716224 RepID=A0A7Y0LDI8_9GAMM|nr:DUF2306 domain-containing protein [Thalassotalea algicola]NMP31180.1 DUF2306 domain-containing protein [Thalassotalea algicola]